MTRKCRECQERRPLSDYGKRLDRCRPCIAYMRGRTEKVCSACRTIKPIEAFYAWSGAIDGRQARCKDCHQKVNRLAAMKAGVRWQERTPDVLRCRVCKEEKTIAIFVRRRWARYGRQRICRPCDRMRTRERRRSPVVKKRALNSLRRQRIRASLRLPEALIFPLQDETTVIAESLVGASIATVAMSLRTMALRGIWEGYQRAMISVAESGPPADLQELRSTRPAGGRHFLDRAPEPAVEPVQEEQEEPGLTLEDITRRAAMEALKANGGKIAPAARTLGVSRDWVYKRLREAEDPLEEEVDMVLAAG